MTYTRALPTLATSLLISALTACGGGSNDDIKVVPTGGALANLWFADSDGYHPLDKLKADGTFYTGSEADFGTVNPGFAADGKQQSRWAIDTSASVEGDYKVQYTMKLTSINASGKSLGKLQDNLRFDSTTGLITQFCSGFPNCYENATAAEEDFLVTVSAKVDGAKNALERSFVIRIR